MKNLNQKGAAQFLVLFILVIGVVAALWLVQHRTNILPKAQENVSAPIGIGSTAPISDYCKQFVTSSVCDQSSFGNCDFSCDSNGKAFYNCYPSDEDARKVCTGTVYCAAKDDLCHTAPCPFGTTSTTDDSGSTICVGNR